MAETELDSAQRILLAASEEFSSDGLAGARVDRIAKRAGLNKQLVFYYYRSKAGLYRAAAEHAAANLTRALLPSAEAREGPEALKAYVNHVGRVLADHRREARLVLRLLAEVDPPEEAVGPVQEVIRHLAGIVSEGQGTGYFRDDVDPSEAATRIAVLTFGRLTLGAAIPGDHTDLGWFHKVGEAALRGLSW
jgi:AcrR family transcriptional regulator